ncbi:MAG: 4-oxalocrotonate tautomerase [Acidobacteria bacterium]|nr:MAG: 4-oxalocrotonate tautomerase [Acidobacteriota bacterium]
MPHVIVKLWPGKSAQQKVRLAQEVEPGDWAAKVYQTDIVGNAEKLYKKPGYTM